MHGVPVSYKYRGIKCDGTDRRLAIWWGIPSGGIDDQYTSNQSQFTYLIRAYFYVINRLKYDRERCTAIWLPNMHR